MSRRGAFTLIELLISIALIALLLGILMPSLSGARLSAQRIVCGSNLRQLQLANTMYSDANDGFFVPGAADFDTNLERWHGSRENRYVPFKPESGPLTPYIGVDTGEAIRTCPTFAGQLDRLAEAGEGFEQGCGGYGYNNAYVGSRLGRAQGQLRYNGINADKTGERVSVFETPDSTVAFTDTAFPASHAKLSIIEYSFAEPRFHPDLDDRRADPSIHFRHSDLSNVVWLDTHVSSEQMSFSWTSGLYDPYPGCEQLGWFGEEDSNELFDPR